MLLELHDSDIPNTLVAKVSNLDYDYQAEQYVFDMASEPDTQNPDVNRWVVMWVLKDDEGVRARWHRKPGDVGVPKMVNRSQRYTGEWKIGV